MIGVLLTSLFAFSPLSAYPFGTPKLMATSVACLILALSFGFNGVRRSTLWPPILAFGAVMAASWWLSVDREMGVLGAFGQGFCGLTVFIQAVIVFSSSVSLDVLADWTVVALLGEALVCVLHLNGWPSWALMNGRAVGTIGGPAFLGTWVAVAAPLAWASRFRWPGLSAGAFLVIATGSRGAGAAIIAAALIVYRPRWLLLALLLTPLLFTRSKRLSDSIRVATWRCAARAGLEHPILGWGPDTFSIANREVKNDADVKMLSHANDANVSAHNDVLQVWATMGGLGVLAYCWFLFAVGRRPMRRVLAMSLLSLFIQAKVNPICGAGIMWGAAVLSCVG